MASDDAAKPPHPSTPPPARAGAPPPPTPVRASLGDDKGEEGPRPEPVRDTAELDIEGVRWTARVGGKSRSGAGLASAPILLVRFECADADGKPLREAWVVGTSLGDLTPLQVEAAFRASEVVVESWARKPLFPEAGSRGGRDG